MDYQKVQERMQRIKDTQFAKHRAHIHNRGDILLCELYDWDAEIINSPDFNAILAETVFETSATEYDASEEYQTFKDAALAVGRLIGVDVSAYVA